MNIDNIDFAKQNGLIPVIVQDVTTRDVLMLGYMNQAALIKTLQEKLVTFWSRTKNRLWQKGETSGNFLEVVTIEIDCDQDTLLIQAKPQGPTCHLGNTSCFNNKDKQKIGIDFLTDLYQLLQQRKLLLPENSYTTSLFKAGVTEMNCKIMEEAAEVVNATLYESKQRLVEESCDLLFHLIVLLVAEEISWRDIVDELVLRNNR